LSFKIYIFNFIYLQLIISDLKRNINEYEIDQFYQEGW